MPKFNKVVGMWIKQYQRNGELGQAKAELEAFKQGASQARWAYDTALTNMLGKKIGILVSDYLFQKGSKGR